MKIYIAGKITGLDEYREIFNNAEKVLVEKGYSIMNPSKLEGAAFTQDDFMHVCYAMIDVCDGVYFLNNWKDSKGANLEHEYAVKNNKWIKYQKIN